MKGGNDTNDTIIDMFDNSINVDAVSIATNGSSGQWQIHQYECVYQYDKLAK